MNIQNIKKQIEKIENELTKDFTYYSITFLKNRLITLKIKLQEKQNFILSA
jgi:hypothetical protein